MMKDKINGSDTVVESNLKDDSKNYHDEFESTTSRNFSILERNIKTVKHNIQRVIRNYNLDDLSRDNFMSTLQQSDDEISEINVIRAKKREGLVSIIEAIDRLQSELDSADHTRENLLAKFKEKFLTIALRFPVEIVELNLQSHDPESIEECEEFEEY